MSITNCAYSFSTVSMRLQGNEATVIDKFQIVKYAHGPGIYTCHKTSSEKVNPWMKLFPAKPINFSFN